MWTLPVAYSIIEWEPAVVHSQVLKFPSGEDERDRAHKRDNQQEICCVMLMQWELPEIANRWILDWTKPLNNSTEVLPTESDFRHPKNQSPKQRHAAQLRILLKWPI